MGLKQSKSAKSKEGSSGSIHAETYGDGSDNGKLKKKSQIKRRLTKAFSKKTVKPKEDNTYGTTIRTTMKKTSSTGSIAPPGLGETRINISSMHSGSITPISISPRLKTISPRAETLSTPHITSTPSPPANGEQNHKEGGLRVYVNDAGNVVIEDGADVIEVQSGDKQGNPQEGADPSGEQQEGKKIRRATTTSSFIKNEGGGRTVALPTNRLSKAFVLHQQIAAKEIGERGAELQRMIGQEKPICDVFEDNPFKKGWCRLCKHAKTVHRDPYSDILDGLEECY